MINNPEGFHSIRMSPKNIWTAMALKMSLIKTNFFICSKNISNIKMKRVINCMQNFFLSIGDKLMSSQSAFLFNQEKKLILS